ncbi:hypothetical protein GCK72_017777 [Caenorhabditis remanei]|uniref:beta-N-acetylhexosaminidase n=1 Tax=Caenorhabditis remanei TaxID=31234 RepID=A0A6A5G953_CAERE|nr:hypothetical protein GCK72_017777 [Caenorhabditis remanei]KAF1751223.1 hypothetical protein GCK72_017777 [Caenorhabditis remanei]
MFPMRCLRRRSIDFILKGVILTTICLFIVHMTSSYPKGGISQRTLDSMQKQQQTPVLVQKRENFEEENGVVGEQQSKKENPFVKASLKNLAPREEVKMDRPSREGEFYKNVVIHFDLKGAPPKVDYFLEMLRLISKGGATGILLEWEDMFPWTGTLEQFKNTDAYSEADVDIILNEAKTLKLDVIPLVQTFGHLEWILKYEEMRKYRENDAYPQVLCLGNEEGVEFVKEMIRQVAKKHAKYGIPFFHIGADEAFEFGVCRESLDWINKNGKSGGKQLLALAHLKAIAEFAKQEAGDSTQILAWHDMLKDFDSRLIKNLELGQIIQPVVWDYSENIITLNDYIFSTLAENFPTMWASSAYKGANYPSASTSEVRHYETNNRNWIKTKQAQERKFKSGFQGIIITGWQRYDHLAGLCETLPIGTASMMLQMQIALNAPGSDLETTRRQAGKLLGCQTFNVDGVKTVSNQCTYKGFQTYVIYQSEVPNLFSRIDGELGKNHHLMGWANRYNRKYNISQNWYHKEMLPFVQSLVAQASMKDLFFENTIDEFIYENLGEMSEKLHGSLDEIQRLDKLRAWPKRHFPIRK